jgi:hypothetical protein
LFIAALERLGPDGTPDTGYRGRELTAWESVFSPLIDTRIRHV